MFETDQAAGLRQLFDPAQLRVIVLGGAGATKASVAVWISLSPSLNKAVG